MAVGFEALGARDVTDGTGYLLLEASRRGHIGDLAAVRAQQVVVVLYYRMTLCL